MLPADLAGELDRELSALESIEGSAGVAPDYVRFCQAVARSQAAARAAIRRRAPARRNGALPATPRVRRLSTVSFELRELLELLRELVSWDSATATVGDQLRRLSAAADAEPALLGRLAEAAALGDDNQTLSELSRTLGAPAPALRFLGRLLAGPFVAEARQRRGPFPELDARNLEPHAAARCPTCDSLPSLAVLCRDDGRRRLLCGLCGDTWLAPRLMCVACGTRDPAHLVTLSAHQQDARWIEACDACRRYLTTVDERRLPEDQVLGLRAEEAASLHLDLMAEEAGYVRSDLSRSLLLEMTS